MTSSCESFYIYIYKYLIPELVDQRFSLRLHQELDDSAQDLEIPGSQLPVVGHQEQGGQDAGCLGVHGLT